jgi:hypothetical protein
MTDLPDFDPVPPTWQQNTAQTINGIMDWLKNNGGTIQQAYAYIQQLIQNHGVLPTIATDTEQTADPLPEINV